MQFYKTVKFKKIQNLGCSQNEQIMRRKCESITNFHENWNFQKKWIATDFNENVKMFSKYQENSKFEKWKHSNFQEKKTAKWQNMSEMWQKYEIKRKNNKNEIFKNSEKTAFFNENLEKQQISGKFKP